MGLAFLYEEKVYPSQPWLFFVSSLMALGGGLFATVIMMGKKKGLPYDTILVTNLLGVQYREVSCFSFII